MVVVGGKVGDLVKVKLFDIQLFACLFENPIPSIVVNVETYRHHDVDGQYDCESGNHLSWRDLLRSDGLPYD